MSNEATIDLDPSTGEADNNQAFMPQSAWHLMLKDIKGGLQQWRIWLILSWQDIRIRYRRSQLGPFWLTISMAITIYTMGLLYGHLFKFEIRNYFPYLAAGMLTWNLVSLLIAEGTNAFVGAEHFIKQIKVPYSVFIMRVICRNLIIFAHTIIVIVPLFFIFHIKLTPAVLMFIPGMALLVLNAFFFGLVLAIIGARYRDVGQLITSVIQVIFFLTPIMWNPAFLPEKYQHWVMLNPFANLIEVVRAPMISAMPSWYSFIFVCVLTAAGALLACFLLARTRSRIIYWL